MRVLIADDNRDSVQTLAMLCQAWGFDPIPAYDGTTALAMLREPNSPMLCLLDWEMPGVTGIDICGDMRRDKDRPYKYIVLITGRGDREEMVAGLDAGADDFLFKPLDANELRARLVTGTRVLNLQDQLLRTMKQLRELATRDGLTGLWNRNAIFDILRGEQSRGGRQDRKLSIALADVDHFKSINDSHGHLVGDVVLRQVADRLKTCVRPYDSVGRFGGEEFLVVLPGCDKMESIALADRLRDGVERGAAIETATGPVQVTVSIGVATWDGQADVNDLVRRADDALYVAKNEGRNRVIGAKSGDYTIEHSE